MLALALAGVAAASEVGRVSWYGGEFDGRPTASGQRFDKRAMTAAHRTLPFGTLVRVTNMDNGMHATVRINDRGPFVHDRVLDCSEGAADALGFRLAGTCRARIEVLGELPAPSDRRLTRKQRRKLERALERAGRDRPAEDIAVEDVPADVLIPVDPDAGPFEVQVGAFRDPANARRLAARLADAGFGTRLVTTHEGFVRVRVGPYRTRHAAESAAPTLGVDDTPFVVRED